MIVKTVEVLRTEFIKITYGVGGGIPNPMYYFDLKVKFVGFCTNKTKL